MPDLAKRMECVELAPAFGCGASSKSASKLVALQTLRAAGHRNSALLIMPSSPNESSHLLSVLIFSPLLAAAVAG